MRPSQLISLVLSVLSIMIVITNFVLSVLDRGKKEQKENHQELIEYQLKELKEDYKNMAIDVKDIKKLLISYKEYVRGIVKEELDNHVKMYHIKEGDK